MSKAVLLSLQPKWCEKICHKIGENKDGSPIYEKRVEVRKTRPKLETPFKVYIYCTKGKFKSIFQAKPYLMHNRQLCNGKVIGEFVCDKIYQYSTSNLEGQTISDEEMQKLSCLTKKELSDYEYSTPPRDYCIYLIGLYGWHISNLVIYDKPKELSKFEKACPYNEECWKCKYYDNGSMEEPPSCNWEDFELIRPPQSWCYVEELSE